MSPSGSVFKRTEREGLTSNININSEPDDIPVRTRFKHKGRGQSNHQYMKDITSIQMIEQKDGDG